MLQHIAESPAIQTGGVVAVALSLVELVKFLVGKLSAKVSFEHRDRNKIQELHRWHAPDHTGVQPWKNQGMEEMRVELRELVALQKQSLETLKRIERKG